MPSTTRGRVGRAPLAAAAFAVARARDRPSRGLVTGLGITVAIASLFVTTASPLIAGDATLRQALEQVAPARRSIAVAVSVNQQTPAELRAIDTQVRADLLAPGLGAPRSQVEYRALSSGDGTVFRLIGVQGLSDVVTMISGRLPVACTSSHCEVLITGTDTVVTPQPELGIEIVGRAVIDDPGIISGQFRPDPAEVVLLGDDVESVGAIDSLSLIGRSIGWVAPIDPASVRVADIDDLLAAATRTANSFGQVSAAIDLPSRALIEARARADTARRRVALAAAQGVVLLVGFTLLAAASVRRQHRAARDLLRQRGASRATVNVFTLCEAAGPVIVGLVLGVPLGLWASAEIADRWRLDSGDLMGVVARQSALRVAIGTVLVLLATAAVMASEPKPAGRPRRWWQPTAVDALGVGALAMAALALDRGSTTATRLVADGDPLIAALPILAAMVVAWVAVRLVPPLVATTAFLLRRRAPLARTALGEVARRPTVPLVTAGFLAAATTLGLFSLGYRSTLAAGAHDQASFTVPLDLTLTSGAALVRPTAIEPASGWAALAAGTRSTEVLRRGVSVRNRLVANDTVTVVGIDPTSIADLRGWRSDFGLSQPTVAAAITPTATLTPIGAAIPRDTTQLVVHGSGDIALTDIAIVVSRADGSWHSVATKYVSTAPDRVTADLEPTDAGGAVIGFSIGQSGVASDRVQHHDGEGATSAPEFTASLHIDGIEARPSNTAVALDLGGLTSDGATLADTGSGLDLTLTLRGTTALVLPPTPAQLARIAAVVDPTTAASADNGLVTIDVPGQSRMTLRVAAIVNRFPGAPARFAIVDRDDIGRAFDLLDPGYGTPNEVWLSVPRANEAQLATALRTAPYDQLVVSRRTSIERALRDNPLARFTLGLFAVAGLIAGLLAVAALYLATAADAAEQAPLHRALAAEGVAPRALSRMVRTSGAAIAIGAVAVGTVGSLLLLRVVARVIAVTATSTVPVPPLLVSVTASDLLVGVAAITVPCLVAAAVAARGARRAARGDLLREFG